MNTNPEDILRSEHESDGRKLTQAVAHNWLMGGATHKGVLHMSAKPHKVGGVIGRFKQARKKHKGY